MGGEERRKTMIQISDEMFEMLINRVVEDKIEVHLEFTPENTTIEIQPWKPYEMKCPYGKDND